MLSYWEKSALLSYEFVVIGGGIVGCFAALSYRAKHPSARIALIERGILPSGASTKNAGFACFGSISELQDDLNDFTLDQLVALTEKRFMGINHMRSTLGDQAIGYEHSKGYELSFNSVDPEQLSFFNEALKPIFNGEPFSDCTSNLARFGFGSTVKGLIAHAFEGSIHTGKMIRALYQLLGGQGVRCFTGCTLKQFEEKGAEVILEVQSSQQHLSLSAKKVAFCTNAFSQELLPDLEIVPGRGLVLITKEIEGLNLSGCFHYNSGYNYFRPIDKRIMLGGARHLDKAGEQTTEFGINEHLKTALVADLSALILPNKPVEVDYFWSGIMAFGANKHPILKRVSERIAVAARLGGMGVAVGPLLGREVAELLES